ncbi:MAG: hypothetical protein QM754_17930 [Tepidisphaeraceae bacterium]
MSFDLFLQRFEHGQAGKAPLAPIREMFSCFAADTQPDCWHLVYDDRNSCHVFLSREDEEFLSSMMVNRPCCDLRLWDSLFRVLESGPWVLYFPAENPPLILSSQLHADHLPPDMRASLGPIREVRSGEEILRIIQTS